MRNMTKKVVVIVMGIIAAGAAIGGLIAYRKNC